MIWICECCKCGGSFPSKRESPKRCPLCKSTTWATYRTEFKMVEKPIYLSLDKIKEDKNYTLVSNATVNTVGNKVCRIYRVPKKKVKIQNLGIGEDKVYIVGKMVVGIKIEKVGRVFLVGRQIETLKEE